VAGLLAIVVDVYSGHRPGDVLDHPLTALDAIGLLERLSPHRRAAYREILARLHALARRAAGRPAMTA
jgi:sulfur transfer protein SufE